jgi:DNA-directed RNA polymerase subunit alpha
MSPDEAQPVADVLAVPSPDQQDALSQSIEDLDLSIRSRRAIETLGVTTIGDLCRLTESDLLNCKNFGQTSLNEIRRKLGERGLSLSSNG